MTKKGKKKADKPEQTGDNRTGVQAAPKEAQLTKEGAVASGPDPGAGGGSLSDFYAAHAEIWMRYASELEPVGTMPKPGTLQGLAKSAIETFKGTNEQVLLDKIGERLAFERTGTRLYEAIIMKVDLRGTWKGGPSRAELIEIRNEEQDHFQMLVEVMRELGADPTAITPSADVTMVESQGLVEVVSDIRTTPAQGLHAILAAELVDNAGWELLIELAEAAGRKELVQRFHRAKQAEQKHLSRVQRWLRSHARVESGFELEITPAPS